VGNGSYHPETGTEALSFRVFEVRAPGRVLEKLAALHRDVTSRRAKSNMLLYYIDEWHRRFEEVLKKRFEAGKRMISRPPPLFLPVRFVTNGG
jgi:hypothetical protein